MEDSIITIIEGRVAIVECCSLCLHVKRKVGSTQAVCVNSECANNMKYIPDENYDREFVDKELFDELRMKINKSGDTK